MFFVYRMLIMAIWPADMKANHVSKKRAIKSSYTLEWGGGGQGVLVSLEPQVDKRPEEHSKNHTKRSAQ